jgi:hypothetical protein
VKSLLSLLVAALVAVLAPSPAHADAPTVELAQWQQPVVTVYARPTLGARWGVDQAIAAWNNAGVVQLVRVDSASLANIRVSKIASEKMNGNAGEARYTATHGYFDWCRVVLDRTILGPYKASTVMHEMGHCMGLADNYALPEQVSVMSYDDMYSLTSPTALDYETLHSVYASVPVNEDPQTP